MRCPKCQYISFDNGDRCRNCGYELSLSSDEPPIEVTIGREEPRPGRVDDISFAALDRPLSPDRPPGDFDSDLAAPRAPFSATSPVDLPLFADRISVVNADDQAPLVTAPAVPRQPLSVRRTNPGVRPRPGDPLPKELSFDLDTDTDGLSDARRREATRVKGSEAADGTAGVFRRLGAGLIDTIILAAIESAVFYLTLRACELSLEQWRVMPLIPLAAFMLLLCGGYFVLFTAAGGQTIGKMATGIRVVAVPSEGNASLRVSFRAALMRAIACLGSVVVFGAGFLPIIFGADRRAFHDRVAETRVVIA